MKRQLQGIALILLGILLALFDMAGGLRIPIMGCYVSGWGFFALLLGIAGAVIACLPNRKE